MGRLIIDGNNVYEIDENCIKNHRVSSQCGVLEKLMESEARPDKRNGGKESGSIYTKPANGSYSPY